MCFENIAKTFENLEYVKLFEEGVVGCVLKMFCKYDGSIANLAHIFREYGAPIQFKHI
jgi:hypothetical protein